MNTKRTSDPLEAAAFINRGGIVAFPTETVYGLGASVFDEQALARIFEAKQRPADNPLIVHIASLDDISKLTDGLPKEASQLIDAFFPGPITVVLNKASAVPPLATAGLGTVGIRMPRTPLARRFLGACRDPIAAPSANRSGRPSPTTWQSVAEDLEGRIDCILQGPATEVGLESTVVDCTGENPVVLRAGGISIEQIRDVVSTAMTLGDDAGHMRLRSPGLRHRHYSPRAKIVIGPPHGDNVAFIGVGEPSCEVSIELVCSSVEEYARSVFEFFRECDRADIATIFCEPVQEVGIGSALMDRIRRASE